MHIVYVSIILQLHYAFCHRIGLYRYDCLCLVVSVAKIGSVALDSTCTYIVDIYDAYDAPSTFFTAGGAAAASASAVVDRYIYRYIYMSTDIACLRSFFAFADSSISSYFRII